MKKLFLLVFVAFSFLIGIAQARQETLYPATDLTAAITSNGNDIYTSGEEVLHVLISITSYTGAGTWTITVEGKWLDGTYYSILSSAALAANGNTILKIGRALTATASTVANDAIPPIFRVSVVGAGVSTATVRVLGNFAH